MEKSNSIQKLGIFGAGLLLSSCNAFHVPVSQEVLDSRLDSQSKLNQIIESNPQISKDALVELEKCSTPPSGQKAILSIRGSMNPRCNYEFGPELSLTPQNISKSTKKSFDIQLNKDTNFRVIERGLPLFDEVKITKNTTTKQPQFEYNKYTSDKNIGK